MPGHIDYFPDELLVSIFSRLSLGDISNCATVSKRWSGLITEKNSLVWEKLFQRFFGNERGEDPMLPVGAQVSACEKFWRKHSSRARWMAGDCYYVDCATHTDLVTCLQFTGDTLITGSRDRSVREWSLRRGTESFKSYLGHERTLFKLQYDDEKMVSCSRDRLVKVWDRRTLACTKTFAGHENEVTCVQYDDEKIVSGSRDQTIRVWDWSGNCYMTLDGHNRGVGCLQFEGNRLLSGAGDNSIKVWDLSTGQCLQSLDGHSDKVLCLQFEGPLVVSGSKDSQIRVWNTDRINPLTQNCCEYVLSGHNSWIHCLQFNLSMAKIVSGSNDNTIKVWCMINKICLFTIFHHTAAVRSLQFDEWRIISGSFDGTCVQWCFSNPQSQLKYKPKVPSSEDMDVDTNDIQTVGNIRFRHHSPRPQVEFTPVPREGNNNYGW